MGRISYLIMAKQAKRDYLSNDKSSQKRDSSSDCSNENLSVGNAKYLYSFIANILVRNDFETIIRQTHCISEEMGVISQNCVFSTLVMLNFLAKFASQPDHCLTALSQSNLGLPINLQANLLVKSQ